MGKVILAQEAKYKIGDKVKYKVTLSHDIFIIEEKKEIELYVVSIEFATEFENQYFVYGLSTDLKVSGLQYGVPKPSVLKVKETELQPITTKK